MSIIIDMTKGVNKEEIARLPEKMLEYAFEALMQQAELMKGLAQVYVRVDTGSLRDSIRVERGGEREGWRRIRVRAGGYIVNPKSGQLVNYAIHVEAKYPYMRPAYEEIRPTIAGMIKAKVVERINQ